MKVYGHTIPQSAIDAVVERMQKWEFTMLDIQRFIYDRNLEGNGDTKRLADRIIQQQRRDGNIEYKNGVWRWIGGNKKC